MYSLLLSSVLLAAEAAVLPRTLPPGCEEAYKTLGMVELNDGPTTSGEAGIGAEFETGQIRFYHETCSLINTFNAKRKSVQGHKGQNFVLSVDTSVEMGRGKLSAEYVLDGRNIRVGDGSAAAAAKAVQNDLTNWNPWKETPPNQVMIENHPQCPGPWALESFNAQSDKDKIWWAPQITTNMPLEALYSLMIENVQDPTEGRNVLNGYIQENNVQIVTKDYFQSLSLTVDLDRINDAVLGFCSLILSYAKAANIYLNPNDNNILERSPKSWLPFMPRTEFITIYKAVKSFFPDDDELFKIFDVLACYKTEWKNKKFVVSIDSTYCTGTLQAPVPGHKFRTLEYRYIGNFPQAGVPTTLRIQDWIQNMENAGPSPDLFTVFDRNYDSSIGGLGTQVEKMYLQSSRTAPLFEFRDLNPIFTDEFETFMKKVDTSVQAFHKKFSGRPMMGKRGVTKCTVDAKASSKVVSDRPRPASEDAFVSQTTQFVMQDGKASGVMAKWKSLALDIMAQIWTVNGRLFT